LTSAGHPAPGYLSGRPTVDLIARENLHPALSDLLLGAAREIHGNASLLQRKGEFPARSNMTSASAPTRPFLPVGQGILLSSPLLLAGQPDQPDCGGYCAGHCGADSCHAQHSPVLSVADSLAHLSVVSGAAGPGTGALPGTRPAKREHCSSGWMRSEIAVNRIKVPPPLPINSTACAATSVLCARW